ncbi:hypothetical protein [Vibrio sp. M260118]|uniref:hypothetical protein n=1 Tax=Vibrio sp. M260118 TaxID=3020896 RepID=UPI002F3EAF95
MAEQNYKLGKQQIIDFFNLEFESYRVESFKDLEQALLDELKSKSLAAYEELGKQRSDYDNLAVESENYIGEMLGSAFLVVQIAKHWLVHIRYEYPVSFDEVSNNHDLQAKDTKKGKNLFNRADKAYQKLFNGLEHRLEILQSNETINGEPLENYLLKLKEARDHYNAASMAVGKLLDKLEPRDLKEPIDSFVCIIATLLVRIFHTTQSRLLPKGGDAPLYRVLSIFVESTELARTMQKYGDERAVKSPIHLIYSDFL